MYPEYECQLLFAFTILVWVVVVSLSLIAIGHVYEWIYSKHQNFKYWRDQEIAKKGYLND